MSNTLIVVNFLFLYLSNNFHTSLIEALNQDSQASQQQQRPQSTSNGDSWQHWWSYDGISGPEYWSINNNWRLCELGMRQSPINIELDKLLFDPNLDPLNFALLQTKSNINNKQQQQQQQQQQQHQQTNSQQKILGYLMNNGRGIEFFVDDFNDNNLIKSNWLNAENIGNKLIVDTKSIGEELQQQQHQFYLLDGPLTYRYKLYKLELHASSSNLNLDRSQQSSGDNQQLYMINNNNHKTSEHTINGSVNSFVGELQLHFYNSQLYSNFDEANGKPNAYAAISIFLMKNNRNNQRFTNQSTTINNSNNNNNHQLDFIFDNLKNISNKGSFIKLSIDGTNLMQLITTKDEYITYDGSLNRPSCSENSQWIVLNKALYIDQDEYNEIFNQMLDGIDNIRPTRPLNGRLLRTSINFNRPDNCHQLDSSNKGCISYREKKINQSDSLKKKKKKKKIESNNNNHQQTGFCQLKPRFAYQINEALRELNPHSSS